MRILSLLVFALALVLLPASPETGGRIAKEAPETPGMVLVGCAKIPAVTTDVSQVTICVEEAIIAQVAAGATTFEDLAAAVGASCGPITVQEIQNIVDLWTSGTTDGGAAVLANARPKLAAAMADQAFVGKLKALKHK
jgi:hypothetical protein